jgi:hypothetical protein
VPYTLVDRYDVSEDIAAAILKEESDNWDRRFVRNIGSDASNSGVSHLKQNNLHNNRQMTASVV